MSKEKKKPKSVDEIVSAYQEFHHKTGKGFKERIKKFEEFHDPENIHLQQFMHHAHYVVFGKPDDLEGFPGAYNEAYKTLGRHVKNDNDKVEVVDKLTDIIETYVDTFLQKAMGDSFKKTIKHAKEVDKLSNEAIRKLKGELMGRYFTDEEGKPINILNEGSIQKLKGKKKIELISHLQGISENIKKSYTSHLRQKALEGLITDEDRLDMARYITPIFEEKGLTPQTAHITRHALMQASHYGALLQGGIDQLRQEGYKLFKPKKKEINK